MSNLVDSYFLVKSREMDIGNSFLDKLIPQRIEATDEYYIPQYSEKPIEIFQNAQEVMEFLQISMNEAFSIYWYNCIDNEKIPSAHIIYTDDGFMILGFSIYGNSPYDKIIERLFFDLSYEYKSIIGCIVVDEFPPTNSQEFIEFCNNRHIPKKL